MNTKQVIVVRTDLKMRRGKESAQCCHASLGFLTRFLQGRDGQWQINDGGGIFSVLLSAAAREWQINDGGGIFSVLLSAAAREWVNGIYTKIVLGADSEAELLEVQKLCEQAGLQTCLVIDKGLTEIPPNTPTALGIGPDEAEKIDAITGQNGLHPLKLR